MTSLDRAGFALVLSLALASLLASMGSLPQTLPAGFGPRGDAMGTLAAQDFYALYASAMLALPIALALLGAMLQKLPHKHLSLPNLAYWLAPQRRHATFDALQAALHRMAIGVCVFATVSFALHWHAALQTPATRNPGAHAAAVSCFVTFAVCLLWAQVHRFATPKQPSATPTAAAPSRSKLHR